MNMLYALIVCIAGALVHLLTANGKLLGLAAFAIGLYFALALWT